MRPDRISIHAVVDEKAGTYFVVRVDEGRESRYSDRLRFDEALGLAAAFVLDRPLPYLETLGTVRARNAIWTDDDEPNPHLEAVNRLAAASFNLEESNDAASPT